jgi:hypothetical protein
MSENIALTPEQRAGLIVDAVEAHAKGASIEKVLDDLVANTGRSHVRKVAEWMETDPKVVVGHQALAALKTAGEGK